MRPGTSSRKRGIEVGTVLLWLTGTVLCLALWNLFRDPEALPGPESWTWRLLGLLGAVPYEDPALIARVRVTRIVVILTFGSLGLVGWLERERVARAVRSYFTKPAHPINLAIFRIVIFLQAYHLGYFDFIARIIALPTGLQVPPPTGILPIGPAEALAQWPTYPFSPAEVLVLGRLMKVACIAAILGLFTRVSSLTVALTFLVGWGAGQWFGKVDHHHHILWFILVLAASRSGDALSIDSLVRSWRRGRRGDTEPPRADTAYGLPLRTCILLMGLLYFFPGFWKIWRSGFDWFLSDSPFNTMYLKWYMIGGWLPPLRPDHFPLLVHFAALGTILFELSFIFLIFGRRTFYLAGALGVTFHTALNVFIRYGFESLRNSYVAFVNWHRGLSWVGGRLFRRKLSVTYDGGDRQTAPLVACARTLDWLGVITWADAAGSPDGGALRSGTSDPGEKGAVREFRASIAERTWRGPQSWRLIAARLPLLWPILPILYVVPPRWLGRRRDRQGAASVPAATPRPATAPSRSVGRPWIAARSAAVAGPFLVGAALFVGNLWPGMTRLQEGWPLACYPLFDGLIDESYTALRIVAVGADGSERLLVPDDYRDEFGNNWNEILQRILRQQDQARRRERLWLVWRVLEEQDPSIGETRLVRFYTVQSSIRPERWDDPPSAPELILTVPL